MKTSTELIPLNQSAWGICQATWPIKNPAPFPLMWASLPNPYPSIWGFIWICSSLFRPPPSLAPLTRLYSPSIQLAGKGQRPSSAKTTCKAFCWHNLCYLVATSPTHLVIEKITVNKASMETDCNFMQVELNMYTMPLITTYSVQLWPIV